MNVEGLNSTSLDIFLAVVAASAAAVAVWRSILAGRQAQEAHCWRWLTASGRPPTAGPSCCATCDGAACKAPVVAVGDGALGLWAALRDVFPETRHQRDWVHKLANVLGCVPKAVQAGARKALVEIRNAPDRTHAQRAIEVFARD